MAARKPVPRGTGFDIPTVALYVIPAAALFLLVVFFGHWYWFLLGYAVASIGLALFWRPLRRD